MDMALSRAAPRVARAYREMQAALPERRDRNTQDVAVEPYRGNNPYVLRMQEALHPLSADVLGALVHGSLGTGDEIAYSDFDALVILRDQTLRSDRRLARAARHLAALRKIMHEYDPLQHHGWFVLTEADLNCYCDAYFPQALYPCAKSLLPRDGLRLALAPRDSRPETAEAFVTVSADVLAHLERRPPRSLYAWKALLSQIMLLPALYYQVRHGVGIYKRESFAAVQREIPQPVWQAMVRVSELRAMWSQPGGAGLRILARTLSPPLFRRLMKARRAPPACAIDHSFHQIAGPVRELVSVLHARAGM